MPGEIDLLQVRIDKAKMELPEETRRAIDAVPWKTTILEMRVSKGYTFEQLGDLETETELLLCGLLSGDDYPRELQNRMKISKVQADLLVKEMNDSVFKKIREELIKITERKRIGKSSTAQKTENTEIPPVAPAKTAKDSDSDILKSAGIEITNESAQAKTNEIPAKKLMESFKLPTVKTDYTLNNLSKTKELPSGIETPKPAAQIPKETTKPASSQSPTPSPISKITMPGPKTMSDIKPAPVAYPPKKDPYRLSPDE